MSSLTTERVRELLEATEDTSTAGVVALINLHTLAPDLARALLEARAEVERLRRGEASCVDDDGTPFASARYWRAANAEACRRLLEARSDTTEACQDLAKMTLKWMDAATEAESLRSDIRAMVAKAAERSLDGYRELGARAAAAENQRDKARAALLESRENEHAAYRQGYGDAVKASNVDAERASIVAWLRRDADRRAGLTTEVDLAGPVDDVADAIEAGEHEP